LHIVDVFTTQPTKNIASIKQKVGWPWSTFCCTLYCWRSKANPGVSCQWIKETHELDIGGDSNSKHKKWQHYIKWFSFELLPLIEVVWSDIAMSLMSFMMWGNHIKCLWIFRPLWYAIWGVYFKLVW